MNKTLLFLCILKNNEETRSSDRKITLPKVIAGKNQELVIEGLELHTQNEDFI